MSEDLTTFQFDEKEWSMDREVIVSDNKWMYRFTPWDRDWAKEPEPKIVANLSVWKLELLNKVSWCPWLEILQYGLISAHQDIAFFHQAVSKLDDIGMLRHWSYVFCLDLLVALLLVCFVLVGINTINSLRVVRARRWVLSQYSIVCCCTPLKKN